MRNKRLKFIKLTDDLFQPLIKGNSSPILIAGLPRTGTTWLASILSTASGIKYLHEPFNPKYFPESASYTRKYIRCDSEDERFIQYCHTVFSGQLNNNQELTPYYQNLLYKKIPWWPGRILVKDVHCGMSLDWIARHVNPSIAIVIRHPCAVAASRFRLFARGQGQKLIQSLLSQPTLMRDYLSPFESLIEDAQTIWQQMAVFWGASYYLMLEQQRQHPEWIVVQHELLCQEPEKQYRQLFDKLSLSWTAMTDHILDVSTTTNREKSDIPERISSQEPEKWKKELEPEQIEQIKRFVQPFGIKYYSDF